jgi:hypothetical protein
MRFAIHTRIQITETTVNIVRHRQGIEARRSRRRELHADDRDDDVGWLAKSR